MNIVYKSFLLIIFTLLCSACTFYPTPQKIIDRQTRYNYLSKMQVWRITGKVAIIESEQNVNVSYTWQQHQDFFKLHFYSPFSLESVTISGNNDKLQVVANDGAEAKEVKLEKELPIRELQWWVRGLPVPNLDIKFNKYDKYNQLEKLHQAGWHIEYQSYHAQPSISLPEKLVLVKDGVKIKLYISAWEQ